MHIRRLFCLSCALFLASQGADAFALDTKSAQVELVPVRICSHGGSRNTVSFTADSRFVVASSGIISGTVAAQFFGGKVKWRGRISLINISGGGDTAGHSIRTREFHQVVDISDLNQKMQAKYGPVLVVGHFPQTSDPLPNRPAVLRLQTLARQTDRSKNQLVIRNIEMIRFLERYPSHHIAVAPDLSAVAVGAHGGESYAEKTEVFVLEAATGRRRELFSAGYWTVSCVGFSRSGRRFAAGFGLERGGIVMIWNTDGWTRCKEISAKYGDVSTLHFISDDELVTGHENGSVVVHDLVADSNREIALSTSPARPGWDRVWRIREIPGSSLLVVAGGAINTRGSRGRLFLVDSLESNNKIVADLGKPWPYLITDVAVAPNGRHFVFCDARGRISHCELKEVLRLMNR